MKTPYCCHFLPMKNISFKNFLLLSGIFFLGVILSIAIIHFAPSKVVTQIITIPEVTPILHDPII